VAIALHAPAATYLVGWNGDAGRQLKANQFLLWHTVLWLRRNGIRWFDLGGIDEVRLPGIADFKLGMGGTRVELVGEYMKL
jgi:lipid II:glycine glycyltransferase (peptidoglycan interpeptide bridge formation enzyme)